ncbi:MAG: TIGR00341 family protein [Epsilonproteobacteria bacterium]|nr:TIGR00341 family protein [Campylobacterota bacterium]
MRKVYYLHENNPNELIINALRERFGQTPIKKDFKKHFTDFEPSSLIVVDAGDEVIGNWLVKMRNSKVEILFLPNSKNPKTIKTFNLPSNPLKALELVDIGFKSDHILSVEEEALLGKLTIGDASWLEGGSKVELSLIKNLSSLKLTPVTISTQNFKTQTAILVLEAGEEALMHQIHPEFFNDNPNFCDRVTLVAYAPQSLSELIKLKFTSLKKGLPKGIGTVKSNFLSIESSTPLTLSFNNTYTVKEKILIKRLSTRYTLITGWKECQKGELKESVRVEHLPKGELVEFFSKKTLPLFPIASEEAFADLFLKIKQNASLNAPYLFLFIVSVLMATIGLFQDSAPTIIGAMILAPLMGPVIAFAMGIIRFDLKVLSTSLKTLLFSIFFGLALSAFLAYLFPLSTLTSQMALRIHPTLLDLAVAILSGLAAAYGYVDSKVGESLAGVAIAVALVPPLCVAGIGLGWGEWFVFKNAFLLFLANVIGIFFAAGVMFYILGFASTRYVSAAFFIKIILLLSITFPLYIATKHTFSSQQPPQKFLRLP